MTPEWGFGVAMLPVGALCFYPRCILGARCFQNHGHFGRISSTLFSTVFQDLGGHASARRVSHSFWTGYTQFTMSFDSSCVAFFIVTIFHFGFTRLTWFPRLR